MKKDLKRGSLWEWGGGGALCKSQVGLCSGAACNGTDDPAGAGPVILREGPAAGNPPSLTFGCSGLWRLAAPGLECAFSLGVVLEFACFVALETEECGMLSPRPEIVSLYLVTEALYSSSGLRPGCVVLEGWGVG